MITELAVRLLKPEPEVLPQNSTARGLSVWVFLGEFSYSNIVVQYKWEYFCPVGDELPVEAEGLLWSVYHIYTYIYCNPSTFSSSTCSWMLISTSPPFTDLSKPSSQPPQIPWLTSLQTPTTALSHPALCDFRKSGSTSHNQSPWPTAK